MPVIQIIPVLIDKPYTVIIRVKLSDKGHHLLALSERIFQKTERIVKSVRCLFRHPVELFSLLPEHLPDFIQHSVADEDLSFYFKREPAQCPDHAVQDLLLFAGELLCSFLVFQIFLRHGAHIVQHHDRLIIPIIDQIFIQFRHIRILKKALLKQTSEPAV